MLEREIVQLTVGMSEQKFEKAQHRDKYIFQQYYLEIEAVHSSSRIQPER